MAYKTQKARYSAARRAAIGWWDRQSSPKVIDLRYLHKLWFHITSEFQKSQGSLDKNWGIWSFRRETAPKSLLPSKKGTCTKAAKIPPATAQRRMPGVVLSQVHGPKMRRRAISAFHHYLHKAASGPLCRFSARPCPRRSAPFSSGRRRLWGLGSGFPRSPARAVEISGSHPRREYCCNHITRCRRYQGYHRCSPQQQTERNPHPANSEPHPDWESPQCGSPGPADSPGRSFSRR